jgi:cbb3-type cytochrome oxidase subunit 3
VPNASQAEIYFIAGMFVLIIVISAVSTYFFFRTYRREKADREKRAEKQKSKIEN